jgi:beta-N-acetylglucosaminidase
LEKEITNWRKGMQTDLRTLETENHRLHNHLQSLEEKLQHANTEKLESKIEVHQIRSQLKQAQQHRDRLEREMGKEVQRLNDLNASFKEDNRKLSGVKCDLMHQLGQMQKKLKERDLLLAKYEREPVVNKAGTTIISGKSGTGAAVSSVTLKAKDFEIQRLQREIAQKQLLEKTVKILEDRIVEIEKENTVLEMKVNRLEAAHEYACELEEAAERVAEMESVNEELVKENYVLRQMVGAVAPVTNSEFDQLAESVQKLNCCSVNEE